MVRVTLPKIFYDKDRQQAREDATHPLTQEYIRRLETVARMANDLVMDQSAITDVSNKVFQALVDINFMDEDI